MSNRTYPRIGSITWKVVSKQVKEKCDTCKSVIDTGKEYCIVEIQTGWFRGDDIVKTYCKDCASKQNYHKNPNEVNLYKKLKHNIDVLQGDLENLPKKISNTEKEIEFYEKKISHFNELKLNPTFSFTDKYENKLKAYEQILLGLRKKLKRQKLELEKIPQKIQNKMNVMDMLKLEV